MVLISEKSLEAASYFDVGFSVKNFTLYVGFFSKNMQTFINKEISYIYKIYILSKFSNISKLIKHNNLIKLNYKWET